MSGQYQNDTQMKQRKTSTGTQVQPEVGCTSWTCHFHFQPSFHFCFPFIYSHDLNGDTISHQEEKGFPQHQFTSQESRSLWMEQLHLRGDEGEEERLYTALQHCRGMESEGIRRRMRTEGANCLPPHFLPPSLHGGDGAQLLRLKGQSEAPPPVRVKVEEGGVRARWKEVFSGNRMDKKTCGGTLRLQV